jgi:DNA invertase Pin-like site-specific DNA recombinase
MQAAIYCRVSTLDQHPETQLLDLQQLASQRGFEVVKTYVDHGVSGTRVRRPGLDEMLADARRGRFEVLLIWSCDRIARSTRHLLEVLDELSRLQIQFVSFREALDTSGALGRAVTVIIGAIAELERSLIIERVRAGMRRAKLEGRHIGRKPLDLDTAAIIVDRAKGLSLRQVAKVHQISTATVRRILSAQKSGVPVDAVEPRRSI